MHLRYFLFYEFGSLWHKLVWLGNTTPDISSTVRTLCNCTEDKLSAKHIEIINISVINSPQITRRFLYIIGWTQIRSASLHLKIHLSQTMSTWLRKWGSSSYSRTRGNEPHGFITETRNQTRGKCYVGSLILFQMHFATHIFSAMPCTST